MSAALQAVPFSKRSSTKYMKQFWTYGQGSWLFVSSETSSSSNQQDKNIEQFF
jgi:hypothetical protein